MFYQLKQNKSRNVPCIKKPKKLNNVKEKS